MAGRFSEREFHKLKARLDRTAKPSLSGDKIDAAIEGARVKGPPPAPSTPRPLTPGLSRGFLGEAAMENFIQKNEISLSDKVGIKGLTTRGLDGVSIGVDKNRKMILKVYENKAYGREGKVGNASAIQKNLKQNLAAVKSRLDAIAKDKNAAPATRTLCATGRDLIRAGRVQTYVTGAGGNVTGTTIPNAQYVDTKPARPGGKAPAVANASGQAKQNSSFEPPRTQHSDRPAARVGTKPSGPATPNAPARSSTKAPPAAKAASPAKQNSSSEPPQTRHSGRPAARAGTKPSGPATPNAPARSNTKAPPAAEASGRAKPSSSSEPPQIQHSGRPAARAGIKQSGPATPNAPARSNTKARPTAEASGRAKQTSRPEPPQTQHSGGPAARAGSASSAAKSRVGSIPKSPTSLAAALSPKTDANPSASVSPASSPLVAGTKPQM